MAGVSRRLSLDGRGRAAGRFVCASVLFVCGLRSSLLLRRREFCFVLPIHLGPPLFVFDETTFVKDDGAVDILVYFRQAVKGKSVWLLRGDFYSAGLCSSGDGACLKKKKKKLVDDEDGVVGAAVSCSALL